MEVFFTSWDAVQLAILCGLFAWAAQALIRTGNSGPSEAKWLRWYGAGIATGWSIWYALSTLLALGFDVTTVRQLAYGTRALNTAVFSMFAIWVLLRPDRNGRN